MATSTHANKVTFRYVLLIANDHRTTRNGNFVGAVSTRAHDFSKTGARRICGKLNSRKTLKDIYGNEVSERRTESRMLKKALKLNSAQLQVAIDENPTCTTRELSKFFNGNEKTWQSLKSWEMGPPPHDLSEINNQQRVTSCVSLGSRELQASF
ncbi:hypothetical protein ACTXT7_012857 [Hymenolepis weldensis]